jgi:hypothetical protein
LKKVMTSNAEIPYLPDEVSGDEKLARVICDGRKPKRSRAKFYFDESAGKYIVKVGAFIDNRNPMQLSVNRISTLSLDRAHDLGVRHRDQCQSELTYHGFAQIFASRCFDLNCEVKKEDYGGTEPYHAYIIYPVGQKEDSQEIAVQLAFHAEFVQYTPLAQ